MRIVWSVGATTAAFLVGWTLRQTPQVEAQVPSQGAPFAVEWFWSNPHCFLRFDAAGADGQVVHWAVETQSGPNILPQGFSKQTFKVGDEVTVTLEPVKNGRPMGRLLRVVLPDGSGLPLGAGDAGQTPANTPQN